MSCAVDERRVIRLGDATTHGGKVIRASGICRIEGRPIARIGDLVSCPKCEGVFSIVEGQTTYCDDSVPVTLHGHKTACGAILISSE